MDKIARTLKIALVQLHVTANKANNISRAVEKIRSAKTLGADIVALPECFNSPYGTKFFPEYAEEIPSGETSLALSKIAKELKIYLIGGTIPERKNNKLYNTCTVWNPEGTMEAIYRKMHLFDIDIPGEITFKESDSLTGGSELAMFNVGDVKIGLGICYDIRFEELAKLYRKKGCNMLVYPGAFNMKTGPLHWELLARGRANDNQSFVAVISPARDASAGYIAYGHSMVVDPWANIMTSAKADEEVVIAEIDLAVVEKVRSNIPIYSQRRTDIYDTTEKK